MPKNYGPKKKSLEYQPTELERRAYNWGVDNGYIIGPFGIYGSPDTYRIGIATASDYKNVKYDPDTYPHDEVMQKVYEYYVYYYSKGIGTN